MLAARFLTRLALRPLPFPRALGILDVAASRSLHATAVTSHCDEKIAEDAPKVNVTFVDKDGKSKTVTARVGQNIVGLAHENEIELEGACECSLACSTCHVILEGDTYDKLPPAPEEEEDLLDLAFGLTSTSRLGCQVKVTKDFDGTKIRLPAATRNFYVDGHKPKPH